MIAPSALGRWALFYNTLPHIATEQGELFCIDPDDITIHDEGNRRRRRQGKKDDDNSVTTLKNFKLFSRDVPQDLQNIAIKDLAF